MLHYNNIAIPEECLHVYAECVSEWDAGDEGKATPSVLDNIEQHKKQGSKKQATNNSHSQQDVFDDVISISLWYLVNLVPGHFVVAIRNDDTTEQKSKHKTTNVCKVVDVGEKPYQEHYHCNGKQFEQLNEWTLQKMLLKYPEHKHIRPYTKDTSSGPNLW